MSVTPRSILLPYQLAWAKDETRFKIGLWSRQIGKSFTVAEEIVADSLIREKNLWVILSRGERQSLEMMEKVKDWTSAYSAAIADYSEDREAPEALIKAAEVRWPNGSRCIALPANPDTARGYSGNLALDEFAFHEKPDEIWRAIYPTITNPFKGVKKVRVISTPNGRSNKFGDLWLKSNGWSKHKVTIHDAVKFGLKVNIDELREGLDDPDGWAQEFECEFMDSAAVLLPYELIALCESSEASVLIDPNFWNISLRSQAERALYIGIDFGRKRDLSVAWTSEKLGDVLHTREVFTMAKTSTPDQVSLLSPKVAQARRVCLDYNGGGIGLGDYLVKTFGEYKPTENKFGKVELCDFSNSFKQEVFPRLRTAFQSIKLRIPIDRVIREDLHAVNRVVTQTGLVAYRAPHTEDGHSDRCTALALCVRAGASGGGPFVYRPMNSATDREEEGFEKYRRFG